ncbi:hypothetical protein DAPPUDRAFT_318779 [Daphnia pulex]|uniref:Uncharacterized protein n=1 Tax=Daphnia pulex TaxID=6669 RepID=E9GJN5_DAPPU|nr:hypothetical protein DAPPUDRAFT_318779 [Daphnia pulex]|eukprot:EFX80287.1 hypothetical protein DAPPUDRAFT_318779 [Daphnia pulex]
MASNGFSIPKRDNEQGMRVNDEQFKGNYPMIGHPMWIGINQPFFSSGFYESSRPFWRISGTRCYGSRALF